ncbi:MAG: hypothetical protein K5925_04670 [Bacilli bacterium]|nr:hypothetical protein [Bacilli bacterium]
MFNLFKASLYKLFREKTFLITMIIGTVLAITLPLIYYAIGQLSDISLCSGQSMLLSSVSTGNNFGLTVPINLAVLVVSEFTTGTLRNKIIAGYRKSFIYASLLFSGIIFTFIMMVYYVGLSVLMGTVLGGFNAEAIGGANFIIPYIFFALTSYIFIASISIFVSSNIRVIGGSLPILIIFLTVLSLLPIFLQIGAEDNNFIVVMSWIFPTYVLNLYSGSLGSLGVVVAGLTDAAIAGGIICPIIYATVFAILGTILFARRDIK